MKLLKTACAALAGACLLATSAQALDIFSIKTSATTPIPMESCTISIASGQVLELNAQDLERRLDLPEATLQGVTITALPTQSQGGVFLDGVEVEAYDFLSRDDLDRLCFVPGDGSPGASITFLPQGIDAVPASLAIQVLETPNEAPAIEPAAVETMEGVGVRGYVNVIDPEEDTVQIKVLRGPLRGEVTFYGQTFHYEPYPGQYGADSFVVCAVDSYHNYSQEAVVEVLIEGNSGSFSYADMAKNPSQYAAVKLWEKGVYTGVQVGSRHFFHPEEQMNRGDFLILLLNAAGLEQSVTPTVNTGLPNDSQLPAWLKPYVKRAVEEGILPAGQAFEYKQIPTRAEAVVLTDRAAKIDDVKEYPLSMSDASSIPDWARPSYTDLSAYKMLDLHDGEANPAGALTNSYGADLAWQLYKHSHR